MTGILWMLFGVWYTDRWVTCHVSKTNIETDKLGQLIIMVTGIILGFTAPLVFWVGDKMFGQNNFYKTFIKIIMDVLTHETAYRGQATIDKIKQKHILVCGCGSVGSNIISNMAKQGFENITVIDNDRIEKHNIGNQTWGLREINGKKVQVMKAQVYASTGIAITPIDKELNASNVKKLLTKDSVIVDGFDNFKSRAIIMDHCKANGIDCIHIGLSETYAEVVWNEKYKIPKTKNKGMDVCEYPLSRNIAMFANIIGIESIIRFISTGVKKSYSITIGDLRIMELE